MDLFTTLVVSLLALTSPLVIAWRKNEGWGPVVKAGVPVVVAALLAIVYLWLTNGFHGLEPLTAFLSFYGLQQIAYSLILRKPSEWIENNTGPTSTPVAVSDDHRNAPKRL